MPNGKPRITFNDNFSVIHSIVFKKFLIDKSTALLIKENSKFFAYIANKKIGKYLEKVDKTYQLAQERLLHLKHSNENTNHLNTFYVLIPFEIFFFHLNN